MSWRWIHKNTVLAIHDEQLAEHGGKPGIKSETLLDSAINRPRQKDNYLYSSLPDLAAAYGFGIARNHAFIDGNKRTAAVVVELFLSLHDTELTATDAQIVETFEAVAAGDMTEEELSCFIVANSRSLDDDSEDGFLRSEDAIE
jgi:death on curing protein